MKRVFYGIQAFLDYMDEKFENWEIWPMGIVSNNYPDDLTYNERDLPPTTTFKYDYFDPEHRVIPTESREIQCTFTPDDPEATMKALKAWDKLVRGNAS